MTVVPTVQHLVDDTVKGFVCAVRASIYATYYTAVVFWHVIVSHYLGFLCQCWVEFMLGFIAFFRRILVTTVDPVTHFGVA